LLVCGHSVQLKKEKSGGKTSDRGPADKGPTDKGPQLTGAEKQKVDKKIKDLERKVELYQKQDASQKDEVLTWTLMVMLSSADQQGQRTAGAAREGP
jgi:hypothetical protein